MLLLFWFQGVDVYFLAQRNSDKAAAPRHCNLHASE
jgi:hypothetical protein